MQSDNHFGKYNPSLGTDHRLVSGLDFLASLIPHIALRYEARIHLYGAISTKIRRQFGWIQKEETDSNGPADITLVDGDADSEFVRIRKKSWAQLIRTVCSHYVLFDRCPNLAVDYPPFPSSFRSRGYGSSADKITSGSGFPGAVPGRQCR